MAIDENILLADDEAGTNDVAKSPPITRTQGQIVSVQSDGTATVNIAGDPEPVPGIKSFTGYTPRAGDMVELEVQGTDTIILGRLGNGLAPPAAAVVATDETIAGGSYGDVTTPGPSKTITVGDSGMLLVIVSCTMTVTDNNDGGFMSFALSGANTLAPSDPMALQFFPKVTGAYSRGSYAKLLTGLIPGVTTVTAKYKTSGADITFKDRELTVAPW